MSKLKRVFLKVKLNKVKNKRGAEVVESILMVGVAISLIVVIFYPQISALMDSSLRTISEWFTQSVSTIVQPVQ